MSSLNFQELLEIIDILIKKLVITYNEADYEATKYYNFVFKKLGQEEFFEYALLKPNVKDKKIVSIEEAKNQIETLDLMIYEYEDEATRYKCEFNRLVKLLNKN